MWHWDQGHLPYFQFDTVRQIATFVAHNNFKTATRSDLLAGTGLSFSAPRTHSPWRNYSRTLKLCLLVSEEGSQARPTAVARVLSVPGLVTCDEYLHFLISAFTEPSPALRGWQPTASFRYPLLFALKYLLAKVAILEEPITSFDEIIGAFRVSKYEGGEDQSRFVSIVRSDQDYELMGKSTPANLRRQARESLLVMAQISYLHVRGNEVIVSLNPEDAREVFDDLAPIIGPRSNKAEDEIQRLADLFEGGSTSNAFDYPYTKISEIVESGFREGTKVKRTHVTIERNAGLRRDFFAQHPTAICDVCFLDTSRTYPWTERIIDLHHLLPLCSGTRVEASGTTLADLVPVCPTCHRAIHRFYDMWLDRYGRDDFSGSEESHEAYRALKLQFHGLIQCALN